MGSTATTWGQKSFQNFQNAVSRICFVSKYLESRALTIINAKTHLFTALVVKVLPFYCVPKFSAVLASNSRSSSTLHKLEKAVRLL